MTQREEFEAWAAKKWGSNAYRHTSPCNGEWDAWQAAQAAQPAQNEWKEAVIEQLAAHSMDAPISDSPTVILAKIIHMAVLQATYPAINVAQPAQVPYLLNGTRFKLNFDGEGTVFCFRNYFKELQGRWVALVAAEDDCHLKKQPAPIPEGWKLVPVEPTPEMEQAAMPAWLTRQPFAEVYRAMLAAAPSTKEGQI